MSDPQKHEHSSLERFLIEFHELRRAEPDALPALPPIDPLRLEQFLFAFTPALTESRRRGDFVNLWEIAGLKRDELRHAKVLAWLLDEHGSHGRGPDILNAWLDTLPLSPKTELGAGRQRVRDYCTSRETWPMSNGDSRVDIEIEGEDFQIIVEVKIGAVERPEQVARYLDLARTKAPAERYAVIFLSLRPDPTLSARSSNLVVSTWKSFGSVLRDCAAPPGSKEHTFIDAVMLQFARHLAAL